MVGDRIRILLPAKLAGLTSFSYNSGEPDAGEVNVWSINSLAITS